jgi:tRNA threonylcarbamoyladenosine biosynthesis protein TsaE
MTTLNISTTSADAAMQFGEALAQILVGGDLIDLRGDLGAGKTTTTVGIARGLGATSTVRSPTFTFVHHHRLQRDQQELLHVDLYRIEDPLELEGIGLFDMMDDQTIVVVEWMERAGGQLPPATLTVSLTSTGPESRAVAVTVDEERLSVLRGALEAAGFAVTESSEA